MVAAPPADPPAAPPRRLQRQQGPGVRAAVAAREAAAAEAASAETGSQESSREEERPAWARGGRRGRGGRNDSLDPPLNSVFDLKGF